MEKDGSSVVSLSERLGISRQYLGDVIAGRRTLKRNPALISDIARELNVPRSMIEHRETA